MKISCPSPFRRAALAATTAIACLIPVQVQLLHAERLPTTIRPEHYALTLTPDLNAATFTGNETIDVSIKEATNSITLNASDLAFQSVAVIAGGKQQTATVTLDEQKEVATFTF